jgi:RNA polymerase sigma-70 factor, ECF subfamily
MVLGICRLMLADPAEAEDAMQQTFFSAYRSILAGSEPQRPAAWLATIARNECLDRIRARTREPLAEQVSGDSRGGPDALNAAIAREDLHALGRTIKELPTQQREALLLHEFHGLPYRDVAAAIGVSESAIASLLFRARARLRSALSRAYASLPVPALWNGADHLFGRGPGTDAALPVFAKLGIAAVAAGLTTGAAIVVENGVNTHHRPRPSTPVHRSAASPAAAASREGLRQLQLLAVLPPVSPSAIVPRTDPTQSYTRPPATTVHRDHPIPPATTRHALHPQTPTASLPQPRPIGKSLHTGEQSDPPSAHRRPTHSSPPGRGVNDIHSRGRSSDPTPLPKKSVKPSAPPKSVKPSAPPKSVKPSAPPKSVKPSAPPKSVKPSAPPKSVEQAPPRGPSQDNHSASDNHAAVADDRNPGTSQNADGPPAESHQPNGAESNSDGDHGAESIDAPSKHQGH